MKHATDDGRFLTGIGQKLTNVHRIRACVGTHCPIHRPSRHDLRDLPTVWADGRMTRLCEHGMLHPDPDDPNFAWRPAPHGRLHPDPEPSIEPLLSSLIKCDGCCSDHETQKKLEKHGNR